MSLGQVELTELVIKSFTHKQLPKKEARKMLKALWKKYWEQGLDSFQEKVVFSSFIWSPDSKKERDDYIRRVLAILNSKI